MQNKFDQAVKPLSETEFSQEDQKKLHELGLRLAEYYFERRGHSIK